MIIKESYLNNTLRVCSAILDKQGILVSCQELNLHVVRGATPVVRLVRVTPCKPLEERLSVNNHLSIHIWRCGRIVSQCHMKHKCEANLEP